MRIAALSDVHGLWDDIKDWPKADILIVAGDFCPNWGGGEVNDARKQLEWCKDFLNPFLRKLPYEKKILISGNHEWLFFVDEVKQTARRIWNADVVFLQEEAYELNGLKFYGEAKQPFLFEWAFNFNRFDAEDGYPEARATWAKIPTDTDVLITHGPPHGILDFVPRDGGLNVGCPELRKRVAEIKPQVHVFGHIHCGYGNSVLDNTKFFNVAICDEDYLAANPIQVFEVEPRKQKT